MELNDVTRKNDGFEEAVAMETTLVFDDDISSGKNLKA